MGDAPPLDRPGTPCRCISETNCGIWDEGASLFYEDEIGQRQRICIARALMLEPRILIADEAVSALDVSVQAEVLQLLKRIRQQMGLTLLFVTHDLRVASQVCDRVMVMQQGTIVETGDIVDVFLRPQHAYTRTLLEAMPGKDFL